MFNCKSLLSYLACRAKAMIPATIGAEYEVPSIPSSVHLLNVEVVI